MSSVIPPRPVRHVYVHVPFCPRRCAYCDFAVAAVKEAPTEEWLAALSIELEQVEKEGRFAPAPLLDTLYVGGGTPSFLGVGAMEGVVRLLGRDRLLNPGLEWTAEANPESFSAAVARAWVGAGVNRVSLGVQSFEPSALRWLNRLHGPEEARKAIRRAREAGIENLSIDLIFGFPQALDRDWGRDLDEALALGLPHISLYGLSVEEGTPLARSIGEGRVSHPSEEQFRDEFLMAGERLRSEGYLQYEVSNFALPGRESRHNRAYWEMRPYLGLGSGAHSFQFPLRRWNLREWAAYWMACKNGSRPWAEEEELTAEAVRLEEVWLGLRTDRGIGTKGWNPLAAELVTSWVARGYATHRQGVLRLTPVGWLLLDHLVVELDRALG